jgi:signal transduction histidine kinase
VEKTQRNAAALLRLIDDLLDLGKIEAGKMDVIEEDFLLEGCVREALSAVEPQLNEKGLHLELNLLPEAWALADYSRTRQILINLLGNAVKFTSAGTVSVSVVAGAETVTVEVRDTGIGIPVELQEQIFDEFRQADSGVARKFGGSGLGLAIARKLALLQKGSLSVSSQPGSGSTFSLTLPLAPSVPLAGEEVD